MDKKNLPLEMFGALALMILFIVVVAASAAAISDSAKVERLCAQFKGVC